MSYYKKYLKYKLKYTNLKKLFGGTHDIHGASCTCKRCDMNSVCMCPECNTLSQMAGPSKSTSVTDGTIESLKEHERKLEEEITSIKLLMSKPIEEQSWEEQVEFTVLSDNLKAKYSELKEIGLRIKEIELTTIKKHEDDILGKLYELIKLRKIDETAEINEQIDMLKRELSFIHTIRVQQSQQHISDLPQVKKREPVMAAHHVSEPVMAAHHDSEPFMDTYNETAGLEAEHKFVTDVDVPFNKYELKVPIPAMEKPPYEEPSNSEVFSPYNDVLSPDNYKERLLLERLKIKAKSQQEFDEQILQDITRPLTGVLETRRQELLTLQKHKIAMEHQQKTEFHLNELKKELANFLQKYKSKVEGTSLANLPPTVDVLNFEYKTIIETFNAKYNPLIPGLQAKIEAMLTRIEKMMAKITREHKMKMNKEVSDQLKATTKIADAEMRRIDKLLLAYEKKLDENKKLESLLDYTEQSKLTIDGSIKLLDEPRVKNNEYTLRDFIFYFSNKNKFNKVLNQYLTMCKSMDKSDEDCIEELIREMLTDDTQKELLMKEFEIMKSEETIGTKLDRFMEVIKNIIRSLNKKREGHLGAAAAAKD